MILRFESVFVSANSPNDDDAGSKRLAISNLNEVGSYTEYTCIQTGSCQFLLERQAALWSTQ